LNTDWTNVVSPSFLSDMRKATAGAAAAAEGRLAVFDSKDRGANAWVDPMSVAHKKSCPRGDMIIVVIVESALRMERIRLTRVDSFDCNRPARDNTVVCKQSTTNTVAHNVCKSVTYDDPPCFNNCQQTSLRNHHVL
jgi:hypothetical protein